ncbi:hypothetical protein HispidOSU_026814, partial [Sigmodon hispidus]
SLKAILGPFFYSTTSNLSSDLLAPSLTSLEKQVHSTSDEVVPVGGASQQLLIPLNRKEV